jgi:serine/threonine protein kinase
MLLSPGSRLGPFEVVSHIASGGMGAVYRARDTRLGRDVAVKVVSDTLAIDEAAMARFEREARAVAALNHPNILALFDIGREGASTYVVTELLEGATLRERIAQGPLPLRKALEYAQQLAVALAAAHERGVVHRDIKPENVFVTGDGRIKVLDFGLAQAATLAALGPPSDASTSAGTVPGTIMGTVGYMSPEQLRGAAVDHRSDIFAFGAVLYELLTGARAFVGATPADTISAVLNSDPPPISRGAAGVPAQVERIVHRCLEKSPTERFQSARDLSFALANDSEPSAAHRRGAASSLFARGLAALAVVALLAIAGRAAFSRSRPADDAPGTPALRFAIPAGTTWSDAVSISPDGQYIVYTGATSAPATTPSIGAPGGRPTGFVPISGRFWLRRLDGLASTPLSDTDSAVPLFFWSPDSRFLGYRAGTSRGEPIRQVGSAGSFTNFSVSPDEQRVLSSRRDPMTGQTSLWLIDMTRGVTSLVSDSNDTEDADDPTWAPDGQNIAYRHGARMVIRSANGGPERTLRDQEAYPDSISKVGRYLIFGEPRGNLFEQWALDLHKPGAAPLPVGSGVTLADEGRVSPNGRWVAYHSNESGTAQVHVVPLPGTGEKWQVSQGGGVQPRWSPDGSELFYLDTEGRLMAVRMKDSDPRTAAAPVSLFATGLAPSDSLDQFAVVRDGFLLRVPVSAAADAAAIQVLTKWQGSVPR